MYFIKKKIGAVMAVISWPWSYSIYNYLCNQCLSPLMLWVRILIRTWCTILCDKVCQWLATGRRFSLGPLVSSTNKTDRHDITEILLKVALNTIKTSKKEKKKIITPEKFNFFFVKYYFYWSMIKKNYLKVFVIF